MYAHWHARVDLFFHRSQALAPILLLVLRLKDYLIDRHQTLNAGRLTVQKR
jgi:hypothetical protein